MLTLKQEICRDAAAEKMVSDFVMDRLEELVENNENLEAEEKETLLSAIGSAEDISLNRQLREMLLDCINDEIDRLEEEEASTVRELPAADRNYVLSVLEKEYAGHEDDAAYPEPELAIGMAEDLFDYEELLFGLS